MTDIHKPKGDVKSYIVHWNKNVPEVRETHWAPGYTPAHCATPAEALAHAGVGLIQDIANIREKWLRLQTLGAHLSMETLANAFGQMVSAGAEEEEPEKPEPIEMVESQYVEEAIWNADPSVPEEDKFYEECPAYRFIDGGNDIASCVTMGEHDSHYAPGVGYFSDQDYRNAMDQMGEEN